MQSILAIYVGLSMVRVLVLALAVNMSMVFAPTYLGPSQLILGSGTVLSNPARFGPNPIISFLQYRNMSILLFVYLFVCMQMFLLTFVINLATSLYSLHVNIVYKFYKNASLKYDFDTNIMSSVCRYQMVGLKSSTGWTRVLVLTYPAGSSWARVSIIVVGLGFEF